MYGLQFHPEVTHTRHGREMLRNFCVDVCRAPQDWNMQNIAEEFVREVREKVGPTGHVIGVDMTPEMLSKASRSRRRLR